MLTVWGFVSAIMVSIVSGYTLLNCLLVYLACLVFSGSLNINEIKRRFPLEIWMIVLGALTLATAIENTGVADVIANVMSDLLQGESVYLVFVMLFVFTLLLTELITNSAAAALVFPIAYNMALGLNVDPMPFVMAVAFGASGSFISPYGYQTNVMIYNAGNYTLRDFVKFGAPISLLYSISMVIMIPLVFPF